MRRKSFWDRQVLCREGSGNITGFSVHGRVGLTEVMTEVSEVHAVRKIALFYLCLPALRFPGADSVDLVLYLTNRTGIEIQCMLVFLYPHLSMPRSLTKFIVERTRSFTRRQAS